jgi:methylenetetrahydrofolate dehydrogenase (NADP+)/methenyltetrahydrofolate cyclohydrolase
MTAKILDGAAVAQQIKQRVAARVAELAARKFQPGLAVVIVGSDPASQVYVGSKVKTCEVLGLYSEKHALPEETTTEQLLALIEQLNQRDEIDGILVQSPPPAHINEEQIIEAIDPAKDVDGFHKSNAGLLMQGSADALIPCTPAGIIEMLDHYQIPLAGANAVVIGRSNIVGKPMAMLLLHRHATVTICHSRTKNLPAVTRRADIVVAAIGRKAMITGEYIGEGAVVVDVGMNSAITEEEVRRIFPDDEIPKRLEALHKRGSTLVGDVEPRSVIERASYLTPVPGGVGPLTIAMLMQNTVKAAERRRKP